MAAVAFMFASTNLVIELGILITTVMYVSIVNVVYVCLAAGLVWLHKRHCREAQTGMDHEMQEGIGPKRIIAFLLKGE